MLHRKHAWRRTPRYTDTRDTQCPSQATPFTFADARGQTPRSFLRAGSPTWKRELPAPVISRSWICLGPLTHLGRDPRSSQEPGAGRKPEALRLPTPPPPPQPRPLALCLSPSAVIARRTAGDPRAAEADPGQVATRLTTPSPNIRLALKCRLFLYCYLPHYHHQNQVGSPFSVPSPQRCYLLARQQWRGDRT